MVRKIEELQAFAEAEFGITPRQALLEIAKIARAMSADEEKGTMFL